MTFKLHFKLCSIFYSMIIYNIVHLERTYSVMASGSEPSSQNDWVSIQARSCGMTCRNGVRIKSALCTPDLKCFRCDCDEHCELLGTCCPSYDEATDAYQYNFEPSLEKNPQQWYNRLDCRSPTANTGTFLTVVKCPESWLDHDVKEKCERPKMIDSMEAITPFSDKTTGLVFTNAFCAICNGFNLRSSKEHFSSKRNNNHLENVDDIKEEGNVNNNKDSLYPWELKFLCPQFQTMYTITDMFEFYTALKDNKCKGIEFKAPKSHPWSPRHCKGMVEIQAALNTIPLQTTCNSSNVVYEKLCHSLPAIPALTSNRGRNIFCSFACEESLPKLTGCFRTVPFEQLISEYSGMLPPTVLLFRPGLATAMESEVIVSVECPSGSWRNNEDNCTQAVCTPGKLLDTAGNSSTCRTAIPDVRGLGYNVSLILVADTETNIHDVTDIELAIRHRFSNIAPVVSLDFDFFARYCPLVSHNDDNGLYYIRIIEIRVSGYIIAPEFIPRDTFEDEYLGTALQSPWDISFTTIHDSVVKNVSLQIVSVGQDMTDLYKSLEKPTRKIYGLQIYHRAPVRTFYQREVALQPDVKRVYVNIDVAHHRVIEEHHPEDSNTDGDEIQFNPDEIPNHVENDENVTSTHIPSDIYDNLPAEQHTESSNLNLQYSSTKNQTTKKLVQTSSPPFYDKEFEQSAINNLETTTETIIAPASSLPHATFGNVRDSSISHPFDSLLLDNTRHIKYNPLVFTLDDKGRPSVNGSPHHRYRTQRLRRSVPGPREKTCLVEHLQKPYIFVRPVHYRLYTENVFKFRDKFIDIVPSLNCPHIKANLTGFSKLHNGSLQFTINVHDAEINITYITPDVSFEQNNLFICLEFLNAVTDKMKDVITSYPTSSNDISIFQIVAYYMDITCTSISILCLTFTFLTYSLFPSLRSIPGRNNMCLCITLATTQISLIITSVFGVRGRLHETHCLVHAMVLHYTWLSSLCWMNTCCVHMYRVFTSIRGPGAWSETKTLRKYCLYSFGIPLLIVMVTIITAHVTSKEGGSIGYDGNVCLPDVVTSPLINVLVILTPFCVTMTINTVLFIRTVREIAHVTNLQQNAVSSVRSRQGVITYFKLSTVTGVFWSLEAVAVYTDNSIFLLIATPFAALQGLFIFASFMFNTTVWKLYKELRLFKDSSADSSRSQTVSSGVSGSSGSGIRSKRQATLTSSV